VIRERFRKRKRDQRPIQPTILAEDFAPIAKSRGGRSMASALCWSSQGRAQMF